MCLILLSWQTHADFPLVVAANRDEFYARPSAPAAFWPDHPAVLAGRDLSAGGTWLGITRSGRFAALTNYRDPAQAEPDRPSRGALVADFLTGSATPEAYLVHTRAYGRRCNGYNLLVGDLASSDGELWWASNVSDEIRRLSPGIYGLSNHLLDTHWPKVGAGKTALTAAIADLPAETGLNALLVNPTTYPDDHLPATGIPLEWERALSAAFIRVPGYGTRASTLVKVKRASSDSGDATWASVCFDETSWGEKDTAGARRRYRFHLT